MFAVDTNVVLHYLKQQGGVAARIRSTPSRELAIPTIVQYELEAGTIKSRNPVRRRRELDAFLRYVQVLPFDAESALAAARVRAQMEERGTTIGTIDYLIAGTAIAHRATLVTHNTAEFRRVPGLKIVDWY